MPALIGSDGNLSSSQVELVEPILSTAPSARITVHFGIGFASPSAFGVTFRKPGKKPCDSELRALYNATPKDGPRFVVAIRGDAAADDVKLMLTLAHELEHVRQELRWSGFVDLMNLARDFVCANRAMFPDMSSDMFIPGELHAEARAAQDVSGILGESTVRTHYEALPSVPNVFDTDPNAAQSALASFFSTTCDLLRTWYDAAFRPTKPSLDTVCQFVEQCRDGRDFSDDAPSLAG